MLSFSSILNETGKGSIEALHFCKYDILHREVIIVQVLFYKIVDKAFNAPDAVLVAVATRDLVNSIA